jgi:transcriptional regulator with XRE-family HTH domain
MMLKLTRRDGSVDDRIERQVTFMPSTEFSKAVLEGMKLHGCSDRQILEITGLSRARVRAVLSEKATLTDRNLDAIENATGRTAGQLASLTLPRKAAPLTYIFDETAKLRSQPLKRSPAAKRA